MSDPRPTDNASTAFWNRFADRYARDPIADEESYNRKLAITRGYLDPAMQLLEIGCGTGSTALLHAPHVQHILAVDSSQRMIEIARDKAAAAGVANVTFQCAPVEGMDDPSAPYDMVLALSVLHLLDDFDAAIARVGQVLAPGGLFVSSTACLGDSVLRHIGLVAPLAKRFGLMPDVQVFTGDALRASLQRHGFAIEHDWTPGPRKATFIVARKTH